MNHHHVTVEGEPLCQRQPKLMSPNGYTCDHTTKSAALRMAKYVRQHLRPGVRVRVVAGPCPA